MPRKKKYQEDEWEVRKTFKYNAAIQYADIYNKIKFIQEEISCP